MMALWMCRQFHVSRKSMPCAAARPICAASAAARGGINPVSVRLVSCRAEERDGQDFALGQRFEPSARRILVPPPRFSQHLWRSIQLEGLPPRVPPIARRHLLGGNLQVAARPCRQQARDGRLDIHRRLHSASIEFLISFTGLAASSFAPGPASRAGVQLPWFPFAAVA